MRSQPFGFASPRPNHLLPRVRAQADPDGDGLVFVQDIADAFKPGAHPEVLEGSREEDDVRREFLESFAGRLTNRESQSRVDPFIDPRPFSCVGWQNDVEATRLMLLIAESEQAHGRGENPTQ